MNTFEFQTIKNELVETAAKLEKEAFHGVDKSDWNACLVVRDELIIAHERYMKARYVLGFELTKQYRDEVAVALDGAAVEMYNFMQRLENAA